MLTQHERNALVTDYIPLANSLAWKKFKSTPKHISYDELQSAAYMGLVDAASRFDPTKYSTFQPHSRINGEMEDYLRSIKWGKRADPKSTVSADDESCENLFTTHDDMEYESKDFIDRIVEPLEPIAKDIIIMYHVEDKLLKEIGEKHHLSPSRVHQILKKSKSVLEQSFDGEKLLLDCAA